MTELRNPQTKPPRIVTVPTDDLVVPDWNPRKFIEELAMLALMAYIRAGGTVHRILVWIGNNQAPWAIISGQRRWIAYKRLGYTQVEVEILDITLEEARKLANSSNEGEPDLSPVLVPLRISHYRLSFLTSAWA